MLKDNCIIMLSGVRIDHTPVVKSFIEYYKEKYKIITVEYVHKKRVRFTLEVCKTVLTNLNANIMFIGYQLYPILLFISRIKLKIFYWALESYTGDEDNSLISKVIKIENYIAWKNIRIILPLTERKTFYKRFNSKSINIIPNAPNIGIPLINRNIDDRITKLVIYGNLNDKYIYLKEWIELVQKRNDLHLTLIGRNCTYLNKIDQNINIKYLGVMTHDSLLSELNNYHFSIIGYRPIDFNHEYCAPNKLYESFSMSLPVIVNKYNPTLNSIISENGGGLIIDFSNIPNNVLQDINPNDYYELGINAYNNYINKFNINYHLHNFEFL